MPRLADRIQEVFEERDVDALGALLAPGATWGDDPAGESFCHDRDDIVGRFRQLLDEGVQATVVGTTTGPAGIAVELHVEWPAPEDQRPELQTVHLAFMVTDGLVTSIQGQDDEAAALVAISG